MRTALIADDSRRLDHLEGVIERGLGTFVEVGEVLMEIRDSRLYRGTHGTFDDYCRERWGMRRAHAYRLIDSAEVAGALSPMGDIPGSERQMRESAPYRGEPATMERLWQAAQRRAEDERRPVTAQDIRAERMRVHYSSATDEWSTPPDFFAIVAAEFAFDLDVCALPSSAKCDRYFGPEDDGLAQEWTGVCWMNPPYGDEIVAWVKKAHDSALAGATVVCLVPARVDTGWWWDYCRFGEIRFIRGRLKFGGSSTSAPFPSALIIFSPEIPPRVVWWER